ncbi:Polyketide cyclase / dehydrase and lipid transport [Pseudarthrobacter enclensis]|uniref:ATPase n=1 Tax=Pseudarthrobacter enclensis TaxID=993070 RepID=A0A0V8IVJ5_9MICC|nr:SRPBCC family protein [Pseudarthrobacter enclensis]KSU78767.1 ATPase [Pseudarthrobacter enclensis]SCB76965.1 Polyketide cyclase / dehydrase and lipid transport [Pseudarthrobacter enclensis]
MVNVETAVVINRPRAEVAWYAANPDNAPRWYVNIYQSRRLADGPLQVGSRAAFTAKFLGRELDYTYEFVEYVPGEKLVMRTAQGPFPMQTTYTWTDDGGGTRMTLGNSGSPTGFSRLAGLVMAPMIRRQTRKDLHRLKTILEANPA